jgi:hypothetical protein
LRDTRLGDALLAECGPPPENGVNDGSYALMLEVEKELLNEGFEYTPSSLSTIRSTAYSFRALSTRKAGISFHTHRAAGSPEYLDAIIAGSPKGTRITQPYVEAIRKTQRAEIIREHERVAIEAEEARMEADQELVEAKKTDNHATIAKAARKAEEARVKEQGNRRAPRPKQGPPQAEEVVQLVAETKFLAHAVRATVLAQEATKDIRQCLEELTESRVRALTEVALEAANAWTEAANIVRQEVTNKHGHLSIFGK